MARLRSAAVPGAVLVAVALLALPARALAANTTVVGTASSITVTFSGENTFGVGGRVFPRTISAGAQSTSSSQVRLRLASAANGESLALGAGNATCAAATTGPSSDVVCAVGSAPFVRVTQAAGASPSPTPPIEFVNAVGSTGFAPDSNFNALQLPVHVDGTLAPTNVDGSNFGDTFAGTPFSDVFDGGSGADGGDCSSLAVSGMAGDDQLSGGAGGDLLQGGAGTDTVDGGDGNDGTAACRLNGGAASAAGDGDDSVKGGLGRDIVDGGAGSDTVSYDDALRTVPLGAGGPFTLPDLSGGGSGGPGATVGTSEDGAGDNLRNFERFTATPLADFVIGTAGPDTVDGAAGADTIDPAPGNDTIHGGDGDDALRGSLGSDTLAGDDGTDQLTYGFDSGRSGGVAVALDSTGSGTMVSGQGAPAETDAVESIGPLEGSAGDDSLSSAISGADLRGLGGDDTLSGGPDADGFDGGPGSDTVSYGDGFHDGGVAVDLETGAGPDLGETLAGIEGLTGGAGPDTLLGTAGANPLDGGGDDDVLLGRAGADALDGGTGANDVASYADGAHAAGVTADLELGVTPEPGETFSGIESLEGGDGADTLRGDSASNMLSGGPGGDHLVGRSGEDALLGEAGNDDLAARDGEQDTVNCGSDVDTAGFDPVIDTVAGCERSPSAAADSAEVAEDAGATAIPVLDNDSDPDGAGKSIADVTEPAHGVTAITGGGSGLTYRPAGDYCGSDSFDYTLNGGSSATVSVSVSCVDDAPVAAPDSVTVSRNSAPTVIDVLANDSDVDGGPRWVSSAGEAGHGKDAIVDDGADLSYRPEPDYCGPDSFSYALNGGATALVSITVACSGGGPGGGGGGGGGGGDGGPDATPPETRITQQPKPTLKTRGPKARAAFAFSSSEPRSRFECSLDRGAFAPCTSPRAYGLKPGRHTFAVLAVDAAGNRDPSPARFSLRVVRKKRR